MTVDRHPHITYAVRRFLPSQLSLVHPQAVQVANVSIWAFIYILCFEKDMGMICEYLSTEITEQMKNLSQTRDHLRPSPLMPHATLNCTKSNLPNTLSARSRIEAQLIGIHQAYGSYPRLASFRSFLVKPMVSSARV